MNRQPFKYDKCAWGNKARCIYHNYHGTHNGIVLCEELLEGNQCPMKRESRLIHRKGWNG